MKWQKIRVYTSSGFIQELSYPTGLFFCCPQRVSLLCSALLERFLALSIVGRSSELFFWAPNLSWSSWWYLYEASFCASSSVGLLPFWFRFPLRILTRTSLSRRLFCLPQPFCRGVLVRASFCALRNLLVFVGSERLFSCVCVSTLCVPSGFDRYASLPFLAVAFCCVPLWAEGRCDPGLRRLFQMFLFKPSASLWRIAVPLNSVWWLWPEVEQTNRLISRCLGCFLWLL